MDGILLLWGNCLVANQGGIFATNSSEGLGKNMVNLAEIGGDWRRFVEICGDMRSPEPRVSHSLEHVCHVKLKVLVRVHSESLEQISGIVSFPSVRHPQVEKKFGDLRNCFAAASRKPLRHAGRRLGFTLYLHSETIQRILQDLLICIL